MTLSHDRRTICIIAVLLAGCAGPHRLPPPAAYYGGPVDRTRYEADFWQCHREIKTSPLMRCAVQDLGRKLNLGPTLFGAAFGAGIGSAVTGAFSGTLAGQITPHAPLACSSKELSNFNQYVRVCLMRRGYDIPPLPPDPRRY